MTRNPVLQARLVPDAAVVHVYARYGRQLRAAELASLVALLRLAGFSAQQTGDSIRLGIEQVPAVERILRVELQISDPWSGLKNRETAGWQ